jgi:hypothetical protein
MRVFKEDTEYQGTPEEIAYLFSLMEDKPDDPNFPMSDFAPLETIVSESQDLREKLAKDPNYNPFPGVVQSKESDGEEPAPAVGLAEEDTGVTFQ